MTDKLGDSTSHPRDPQHPRYSVIVVAEGAYPEDGELILMDDRHDAFGHAWLGGIAEVLARRIMGDTTYDARSVILGHPQRGGPPSPVDRIMGLMFGARAADAIAEVISARWFRRAELHPLAIFRWLSFRRCWGRSTKLMSLDFTIRIAIT